MMQDLLDRLLETYVERHLATGLPPDLSAVNADHPELMPELVELVRSYHQLDGSFGMPAKDLSGRALGPFRVLGPLARGALSEIYQALDVRGGKRVVLKLFPSHLLLEDENRERFDHGLMALAEEGVSGLPDLYEVGTEEGLAYLSMEKLEGRPITPISDGAVRRGHLRAIADALARIHAADLVLGDLAPKTVLIEGRGVRILAWGVSTLRSGVRQRGSTPDDLFDLAFAAPEQLTGKASSASDVFSLATLVAYSILGVSPFEGASRVEIARSLGHAAAAKHLPVDFSALERLLRACWQLEPGNRPTAEEFRAELASR